MIFNKTTYISILLFFIGIIVIILGSSISFASIYMEYIPVNNSSDEQVIIARDEKIVDISLSFIGDSLIGSFKGYNYSGNFRELLETHDYKFPYKNVSHIFEEDDFTIANGENVFTDKNLSEIEKGYSPAYWYYAPTRFANIYKESSIEVVSVMNNHTYDYGTTGYNDTIKALEDVGVSVGAEEPLILEKDNVKIGIICINLFSGYQYDDCISKIKKIRNSVDYLIVYFHGGIEYLYKPVSYIVDYSRGFIDNGVDLVIGAHPHVLEPIEHYKNKTIVYSLGSYLFGDARFVNRTIIYQMKIKYNLDKKNYTEEENLIPCYLYTGSDQYETLIPSVITNEYEKQRVLDFMNGFVDSPI